MSVRHRLNTAVRPAWDTIRESWRRARISLPRPLRTAELIVSIVLAAALIWIYRATPVLAGTLALGVGLIVTRPRALAVLFPFLTGAAVFGADSGTLAARLIVLSLLIALWHIDGLRTKGLVYAEAPSVIIRHHTRWLALVLLASAAIVLLGNHLVLDLPLWLAVLLVPILVVITALLARSRTGT